MPLTYQGRLRNFATRALSHYALESPRLTFLSNKEHAVFRVDARSPGAVLPERFALRLYLPEAFHEPSVVTELEWLSALRQDMHVVVPEPIPSRAGELLVRMSGDGAIAPRSVALFRWVDGRRRKASLTPKALDAVGRFVGQLHEHATHFTPSVGRAGQRWDWEHVFGDGSPVAPEAYDSRIPLEQRELFRAIADQVRTAMDGLGTGHDVWGLIHADLHSSNYLFQGLDVRAIDFEDCGWGYYLYDLAVILDEIHAVFPSRASALRQGLLDGYRQFRNLSDEHESLLDLFVAMRLAELVRWHATSDDAANQAAVPLLLDEATRHIRQCVFSIVH